MNTYFLTSTGTPLYPIIYPGHLIFHQSALQKITILLCLDLKAVTISQERKLFHYHRQEYMAFFNTPKHNKPDTNQLEDFPELAGVSLENVSSIHMERAEHILREAKALEQMRLLTRDDVREAWIMTCDGYLDLFSVLEQEGIQEELNSPELDKVHEIFDKIDTTYKPLDELTDEELQIFTVAQKAFHELHNSTPPTFNDKFLTHPDSIRELRDGLEGKDPEIIVRFAYELINDRDHLKDMNHPLGAFKFLSPILAIQRVTTWTDTRPEFEQAAALLAELAKSQLRRRALTTRMLAISLSLSWTNQSFPLSLI